MSDGGVEGVGVGVMCVCVCVYHKRYMFACARDRKKRFVYVKCTDLRCAGVFFYACVCV